MTQTVFSGFCQYPSLVINGSTSPIGEITVLGESYAKEPHRYYSDTSELIIHRGVAGELQHEKIPTSHQKPVLNLCDWVYQQANSSNFNDNSQAVLQALSAEFGGQCAFKTVGNMITDGRIWLPSHIYFTMTIDNVVHDFKIWFAIQNFIDEFPYRDIYVFGPVPPEQIDLLMTLNYRDLEKRLAEETASRLQARIDKLIDSNKYPYSKRLVVKYDIYDLINKPHKVTAEWTIVIYGNPNNAEDDINEAIKNCILSNSSFKEPDWEDKIPDLFNPLEFFIVPHFNEIGIENETNKGSTYSPIFSFLNGEKLSLKYADFYNEDFIKSSLQIVPHLWKSVKMSIVGKPKNNLNQTTFLSVYPDYQIQPSTDSQVGMMSEATQEFIAKVEDLLSSAEIADETTVLPNSIYRVTRRNRLYLSSKIGKVKFTCITRKQFIVDGLINE